MASSPAGIRPPNACSAIAPQKPLASISRSSHRRTGRRRWTTSSAGSAGAKPSNATKRSARRKDGTSVEVSLGIAPIKAASGAIIGISKTARDMTESQQAQETLRESEQLARGIINSAIDAFVQVDQRGIIQDWNPQAETIFGWRREEVLGKNVFDLMGRQGGPGPIRTALERFLLSGRDQVQQPRHEVQIRRRDGRELTAELSITALRTRGGFVFNAFIRDITEQNRTQQTLRQQAEELRRIFETSQDLIMVMDSRGALIQISPSCETILGYPPDEMIGRTAVDFVHSDHLANSREEMRALRRGERPKLADMRCLHKDGREVWLSWLGVWSEPVRRFFFVGRDMSESRKAAGDIARKRANGARHYQHRARRLHSERREQQHRRLEFAGGSDVRVVTRGSPWKKPDRLDHCRAGPCIFQGRPAALSGVRGRIRSSGAAAKLWPNDTTERNSEPN